MLKSLKYLGLLILLVLIFLWVMGEKADFPETDPIIEKLSIPLDSLDTYIEKKENQIAYLKPDNQARVVWVDSLHKSKTEYSLVYLHGFSASQEEGDPVHEAFANRYGCNLFLSRLEDHGRLDSNSFAQLTPANYLESAKEAIAIGALLGDKVIVMSCSTGGTLSAYLAAHNPWIHSQIMYSPNIDLYDLSTEFITLPWGEKFTQMSLGGDYYRMRDIGAANHYWTTIYHMKGIVTVKYLLEKWMVKENFEKIHQPTFLACYYKNRKNQDKIVSVRKMRKFYNLISTSVSQKTYSEIPDAGNHAICSGFLSKGVENVQFQTYQFAEKTLGLLPVKEWAQNQN